jgi:hypothetical protein
MRRHLAAFQIASLALAATILLGSGAPAHADRVVLKNGNFLEGQAEVLDDGSVVVTSAMGSWTVAAHRVERVERSQTPEEHVERVLRATPEPKPGVLYDLAVWARERGAWTLSRQLAERAIELDADHEPARRLLGHRYHEGRWLTQEEWRRATANAGDERDERLDRELALREATARLAYQSARLELASRLAGELRPRDRQESDVYGFPLGWVLAAPTGPGLFPHRGGFPHRPVPQIPPAVHEAPPTRARAPSADRPVVRAPASVVNRGRFAPPAAR